MMLLAALILSSPASSIPAKVDFALPMSTVKSALEEISRQSGQKIEHEGIGHLPILIEAKAVDAKTLLGLVAKATDSDLSPTTEGFRLVRSPSRVKTALDLERAETSVRLEKAINEKRTEWASSTDWTEKGIQAKLDRLAAKLERPVRDANASNSGVEEMHTEIMVPMGGDSPAGALLVKLLMSLPATTWVGDTPSGTVRLSDKPNQFQRKLNIDLTRDYGQFIQVQNAMRTQLDTRLQLPPRTNVGLGTRDLRPGEINRAVVLANWQHGNWLALNLYLTDASGSVVGRSTMSFALPSSDNANESLIASETAVTVPADTVELAKALRRVGSERSNSSYQMSFDNYSVSLGQSIKMPKLPPTVLSRMTREQDPFEDFCGVPLRTFASEEKLPLVAILPNRLFGPAVDLSQRSSFTLKAFGQTLRRADMILDRSSDGLVLRPRLAAHLDRNLANRAALHRFASHLATQGFASLDQTLAYARSRMDTFREGDMDFLWLQAINAATASDLSLKFSSYQMFSELPEAFRKGVDATAVRGELLKVVGKRLTNHHGGSLIIGDGTAIMRSGSPQTQHIGTVDVSEPLSLGSVQIQIRNGEVDSLFVKRDTESGGRFVRAQELGIYRAMSSNPNYAQFTAELLPYDSYQKAKSRRVEISLTYDNGQGFLARDELHDNAIVPGGGKWTYSNLPADIKNLIVEGETLYKSRYGGG